MKKINDSGTIVWRDMKGIRGGIIASLIIFVVLIVVIFSISDAQSSMINKILGIAGGILFIYGLLILALKRHNCITSNGIKIGNITAKHSDLFFVKSHFFSWDEIDSLRIKGKLGYTYASYFPFDYLFLKCKGENKKYYCRIDDTRGFIKALKSIKKSYLLDEKTKYRRFL